MAYELRDYLEIDEKEAIRQWLVISQRVSTPGKRQEPFRPIETVLCFGLFRVVDPNRYGGGNKHLIPDEAQRLARTLRRPATSLLYKMQNLLAHLPHGAKQEPLVFVRLSSEPGLFESLHDTIVQAARSVGLDERAVPNLVGGLRQVTLVGQDEIGSEEIGIAQHEYESSEAGIHWRSQLEPKDTERLVEARVRIGQDRFARQVLAEYDHRCAFCGFAPQGMGAAGMLIASHIKPWAKCEEPGERLDPRNGIAACPIHDRAFDSGWLTVNGGRRIHRFADLDELVSRDVAARYFFGAVMPDRLLVPTEKAGPGKKYLDYHKKNVFRGTA